MADDTSRAAAQRPKATADIDLIPASCELRSDNPPQLTVDGPSQKDGRQVPSERDTVEGMSTHVKFRWVNNTAATPKEVRLSATFTDKPILLRPNEESKTYVSEEACTPYGDYKCTLHIDAQRVSLEEIRVRFYTFEVDLFAEEREEDKKRYGEIRKLTDVLDSLKKDKKDQQSTKPAPSANRVSQSSDVDASRAEAKARTALKPTSTMEKTAIQQRLGVLENLLRQQIANGSPQALNGSHGGEGNLKPLPASGEDKPRTGSDAKASEGSRSRRSGGGSSELGRSPAEMGSCARTEAAVSGRTDTVDGKLSTGKVARWMVSNGGALGPAASADAAGGDGDGAGSSVAARSYTAIASKPADAAASRGDSRSGLRVEATVYGRSLSDELLAATLAEHRASIDELQRPRSDGVTVTSATAGVEHAARTDYGDTRHAARSAGLAVGLGDYSARPQSSLGEHSARTDPLRPPQSGLGEHSARTDPPRPPQPELKAALVTARTTPLVSPARAPVVNVPKRLLAAVAQPDAWSPVDAHPSNTISALSRLLEERNAELSELKQSYASLEVDLQQLTNGPAVMPETNSEQGTELDNTYERHSAGCVGELATLRRAYDMTKAKLYATERKLRECQHDHDSAQIAHDLHAKQLEHDNHKLRQQLVLLLRDQKTSSESERRCDSDTAKTSSTISRQAAPRLRRPLTDILTDNIDIQNVNPCSDEQSSDLLNYSRFGETQLSRSAETYNRTKRIDTGYSGASATNARARSISTSHSMRHCGRERVSNSRYYDRSFSADGLKSQSRKCQSAGGIDKLIATGESPFRVPSVSDKISAAVDAMVLPKQPDPVEDVLIENARPLYPIPYRDRLVGDIITADSASRNGLPRDNIDDETPLANLTLDDLSTVEPSFDDVIGRTRHQLYDAGGDRWSNSRDAAQPHQDDVMRDVDALDSQLALGVEVDARQRRARRDSVDSTSTEAILREAEQALHPDETKSQADIEVVERPPGNTQFPAHSTAERSLSPFSLRSISPTPLTTQHNKHLLPSPGKDSRFNTSVRRAFAPRAPADVQLGDVVKFSRQGGRISRGLVKYMGHLPGKNDTYLGVELEKDMGKHDGCYEGQRYFHCKTNRGVFVAFSKVVLAWSY